MMRIPAAPERIGIALREQLDWSRLSLNARLVCAGSSQGLDPALNCAQYGRLTVTADVLVSLARRLLRRPRAVRARTAASRPERLAVGVRWYADRAVEVAAQCRRRAHASGRGDGVDAVVRGLQQLLRAADPLRQQPLQRGGAGYRAEVAGQVARADVRLAGQVLHGERLVQPPHHPGV